MAAPADSGRDAGLAPAYAAVRTRLGLVAALFAIAGIGWAWTAFAMRGMDAGPWTGLGSLGWFLGVWIVMMAAMMFPSVAPTVALYARVMKERSPLSSWLFAGGYLLTWTVAGLHRRRHRDEDPRGHPRVALRRPRTCRARAPQHSASRRSSSSATCWRPVRGLAIDGHPRSGDRGRGALLPA